MPSGVCQPLVSLKPRPSSTDPAIPSPVAADDLIREAQVIIEPVTEVQARIAREAYRDFGRGSGHPARLNFGDCFAYALATVTREALLFKGQDFAHTDVAVA
jgi:ribonuclease VapC